ncbi:hypothetical protein ANN_03494 [Periplaneta americana]|uniref:Uncharacterized protein n=1 Tax=Periplaneta americana TaxID=6978 RepID=A0ABQ8U117_PERAM|nr:hypothetical protein ANN_03494 [Periplaneta americana]
MLVATITLLILSCVSLNNCLSTATTYTSLEESIAYCVLNIGNRFFRKDIAVTLQTGRLREFRTDGGETNHVNDDTLLRILTRAANFPLIILGHIDDLKSKNNILKPGSAILTIHKNNNDEQFREVRYHFTRFYIEAWNPACRLVIISESVPYDKFSREAWALKLLIIALDFLKISQAIVLIPKEESLEPDINVYTWLPDLQDDLCKGLPNHVTLLDRWVSANRSFLRNVDLFPSKQYKDMKGCTLNIGIRALKPYSMIYISNDYNYFYDGPAANIIMSLATDLNFTLSYEMTKGHFDMNDSPRSGRPSDFDVDQWSSAPAEMGKGIGFSATWGSTPLLWSSAWLLNANFPNRLIGGGEPLPGYLGQPT